jgi:hypothetical protein
MLKTSRSEEAATENFITSFSGKTSTEKGGRHSGIISRNSARVWLMLFTMEILTENSMFRMVRTLVVGTLKIPAKNRGLRGQ